MKKEISCCGMVCSSCSSYKTECKGCNASGGAPCWIAQLERKACYFYTCCKTNKKLQHCGQCPKLPCSLFYILRDPTFSEREHQKLVEDRVAILRSHGAKKRLWKNHCHNSGTEQESPHEEAVGYCFPISGESF